MSLPLEAEAWTWYGVVMLVVFARFTARYLQFKSIKKFQWEDLCMAIVAMLYTVEVVLLVKSSVTPTNLILPGQFDPADTAQIALEVYGSKLIVALEMVYCATIWGCKGCLLLFYANLTYALPQNMWVKIVAVYAFTGYIVMVILYMGVWCQPFYDYWSVPAANPQCSTAEHHLIVNFVFNVSSDLLMMLIPLPMLIRTNLPLQKKLVLCAVFSLGIFCILCAVLNKFYSFTSPYGSEWVYWYDREVSTAVLVANVPHLWVFVKKAFHVHSFIGDDPSMPKSTHEHPHRFFENTADPLETGGAHVHDRRPTFSNLEGVDIDEYLAMDDVETGRGSRQDGHREVNLFSGKDWAKAEESHSTRSFSEPDVSPTDLSHTLSFTRSSNLPRSASTEPPVTMPSTEAAPEKALEAAEMPHSSVTHEKES